MKKRETLRDIMKKNGWSDKITVTVKLSFNGSDLRKSLKWASNKKMDYTGDSANLLLDCCKHKYIKGKILEVEGISEMGGEYLDTCESTEYNIKTIKKRNKLRKFIY